ncbi:MAG: hypothetical protein ACPLRN_03155 [Microgenomates group bacterium]
MIKRKKINLIINREDYQKYEQFFQHFKIAFYIFASIFILLSIIFFIIIKNKVDNENKLINQKKFFLQTINQKTQDLAKLNYLQQKYQDLKTFLKDDAFSANYYDLLSTAIKQSSEEAALKSFNIDKSREVGFTVVFSDFNSLRGFLKFIESTVFLNNFETLVLKSYNITGARENTKETYELNFEGKFKPLSKTYEN